MANQFNCTDINLIFQCTHSHSLPPSLSLHLYHCYHHRHHLKTRFPNRVQMCAPMCKKGPRGPPGPMVSDGSTPSPPFTSLDWIVYIGMVPDESDDKPKAIDRCLRLLFSTAPTLPSSSCERPAQEAALSPLVDFSMATVAPELRQLHSEKLFTLAG